MKNVRLFYKKTGKAKFVSHLDTLRFMGRLLRRAEIPVCYTEGFNPHLYITFALPLSLGFESEYEIADIRIEDDGFPLSCICERLNRNSTDGFVFFDAKEPEKKLSELTYAGFKITFDDGDKLESELKSFLSRDEINIQKINKKGKEVITNVAPDIKSFSVCENGSCVLDIVLSAGSVRNVNPELILEKFFGEQGIKCFTSIIRTALYDKDLNLLK